jgi:Flp pilus assembly protein TadG
LSRRHEGGQATVEFALVLPLLALVVLALVEFGVVVRDQVLVAHGAREAARAAAVGDDPGAAALAGSGLTDLQVTVSGASTTGSPRTVRIVRRESPHLPFLGRIFTITLSSSVTMRFEGPP